MQYLKNFLRRISEKLKFHWNQFLTSLPLRMQLGKLGIWLAKVGRILQTRYANWNSEFRLEHEFHPDPDRCSVHVSEPVTNRRILSFDSPSEQVGEQTEMIKSLFGIKGVVSVTLKGYEISIGKGRVYNWNELLPSVDEIIVKHLTVKEEKVCQKK